MRLAVANQYKLEEKYESAILSYEQILLENSLSDEERSLVHLDKALVLKCVGKLEAAIKNYDKSLKFNPSNATAYTNKGAALYELEKYEEALENHDLALKLDPKSDVACYNKGLVLMKLEKYDEALNYYDKALDINPNLANAYYNKAGILHSREKYDEALNYYNKAIAIDPDYAPPYNLMGEGNENSASGDTHQTSHSALGDFSELELSDNNQS
jgi:tetratricopeptide (TPR) repeat protein